MSDNNFTAVEVLVGRMESNPDEFLRGGRLGYIADAIYEAALSPKLESERLWFFKDAEKIKLIAAYREFCRKQFQDELFKKLFEDKEPVQAELSPLYARIEQQRVPLQHNMEKQKALLQQECEARMAKQQSMSNSAYNAWPGGLLTTGGLK